MKHCLNLLDLNQHTQWYIFYPIGIQLLLQANSCRLHMHEINSLFKFSGIFFKCQNRVGQVYLKCFHIKEWLKVVYDMLDVLYNTVRFVYKSYYKRYFAVWIEAKLLHLTNLYSLLGVATHCAPPLTVGKVSSLW